jgi:hypothetical protein
MDRNFTLSQESGSNNQYGRPIILEAPKNPNAFPSPEANACASRELGREPDADHVADCVHGEVLSRILQDESQAPQEHNCFFIASRSLMKPHQSHSRRGL